MMRMSYHDEFGNFVDYYEILNIPYQANKSQVRTAFCNLVKIYHPDISKKNSDDERKKIDLIIKGYKVLIDDSLRLEYNKHLFDRKRYSDEGYVYVPKTRIKFSISLKDLVVSRLLNRKMKREDRIYNFGQDVEIFVTPGEIRRGAIAFIELPSRIPCPLCFGDDSYCRICQGLGRISNTSTIEVKIPPGTKNGTTLNIDLMKIRLHRLTTFTMKNLIIKISIIGKGNRQAYS
ncbi:MAG: DnaJ domain-containing protein [Spirochaetota bacterium]|nr:DnaJ domain-containing protein [Spirochaetota bacterium]